MRNGAATHLQQLVATIRLSVVTLPASVINGLVTVGLPTITENLKLPASISLWPLSVGSLATASTLLLAGGALMLGQGLSRNDQEFVALRALQGVELALHLASSVSLLGEVLPQGRGRNLAFSCLGLSLPLGFSLGLVDGRLLRRLRTNVDWVGAGLGSAFMSLLCYLLATLSVDPSRIKSPEYITILCFTATAFPAFIAWPHHRVNAGKPALIPNALWKNRSFSSICATVALSNRSLSAPIRILPSLVAGVLVNIIVGLFVHRISAFRIVTAASAICAVSTPLMALVQPSAPYWANGFLAHVLQPVSFGALYTVGLIVITDSFAKDTQALAESVFNTASQFGNALGLAVLQVVSTVVSAGTDDSREKALMNGYRASFWTMFGSMILCTFIGF
ncbi:major facilitator superfamily domain-containing protein [Aspergillus multicolor]|uniref:putative MFS transporter n=1 Tax=Aspergillus multicolor TaxID=41759 RepID=UPI003CCD7A3E